MKIQHPNLGTLFIIHCTAYLGITTDMRCSYIRSYAARRFPMRLSSVGFS